MRKKITEAQITELMAAIPRAEEVDRLRTEVERLRAENKTLRRTLGGIQVTGPDADGIAWLRIAPRETTWVGTFSLGNGKSMAGQVALLFEELRCEALKEDGR